jgi:oxygen-independent coproporphyrinogen III oxidase
VVGVQAERPEDYQAAIASGALPSKRGRSMSRDDRVRKDVIDQIMCHGFVDIPAVGARNTIVFAEYFARELQRLLILQEDGLVKLTNEHIALTPIGRLLMRNVAMIFDAYLDAVSKTPAMSRVI